MGTSYYDWGSGEIITSTRLNALYDTSGRLLAPVGTKTNCAYSFTGDADTGIYRIAANNIGISCADTKIVDITSTGLTVTGALAATTFTQPKSGSFAYNTGGTQTIFTAAAKTVYLVSCYPDDYGGSDERWGTWIVSAVNAGTVTITSLAVGSTIGGGTTPVLSNTGLDIKLTYGSGAPDTKVNWIILVQA